MVSTRNQEPTFDSSINAQNKSVRILKKKKKKKKPKKEKKSVSYRSSSGFGFFSGLGIFFIFIFFLLFWPSVVGCFPRKGDCCGDGFGGGGGCRRLIVKVFVTIAEKSGKADLSDMLSYNHFSY